MKHFSIKGRITIIILSLSLALFIISLFNTAYSQTLVYAVKPHWFPSEDEVSVFYYSIGSIATLPFALVQSIFKSFDFNIVPLVNYLYLLCIWLFIKRTHNIFGLILMSFALYVLVWSYNYEGNTPAYTFDTDHVYRIGDKGLGYKLWVASYVVLWLGFLINIIRYSEWRPIKLDDMIYSCITNMILLFKWLLGIICTYVISIYAFGICRFAISWVLPSLLGSHSLGSGLYYLDNTPETKIVGGDVVRIEGNTCVSGISVIPNGFTAEEDSLKHQIERVIAVEYDSDWVIAKTYNSKNRDTKFYIIDKSFDPDTTTTQFLIEHKILEFSDTLLFANECHKRGITLCLKNRH